MAHAIYAPRVNNNDDEVQLIEIGVKIGQQIAAGQIVATVETSKAAVDVEAERAGYVLRIDGKVSDFVAVGAPLLWIGDTPDEKPPAAEVSGAAAPAGGEITAKAAILLKKHGLRADQVRRSGDRLTVADIEAHLASAQTARPAGAAEPPRREAAPVAAGKTRALNAAEKGMLQFVAWHRDEAVPGYVEYATDAAPWDSFADAYGKQRGLMTSPLLGLLALRLVSIVKDMPRVNSTMYGGALYEYEHVNVGFTVQADDTLYLAVLREAEKLDAGAFLSRLGELQRKAFGHKLGNDETTGATVAFSSMARWGISRHVPILPPHVSLMIAHAAPDQGRMVLGATYDHRVLGGADVAKVLRALGKPEN